MSVIKDALQFGAQVATTRRASREAGAYHALKVLRELRRRGRAGPSVTEDAEHLDTLDELLVAIRQAAVAPSLVDALRVATDALADPVSAAHRDAAIAAIGECIAVLWTVLLSSDILTRNVRLQRAITRVRRRMRTLKQAGRAATSIEPSTA